MGLARFFKTKGTPLLAILEDAHWTDPSTQEFIDQIVRRSSDSPVMLIVLKRPQINFPWDRMSSTKTIELNSGGWTRESGKAIINRVTLVVSPMERANCRTMIVEQDRRRSACSCRGTDQIPSSKAIWSKERNGKLTPCQAPNLEELDTPASLMDSLMVRLDQVRARQRNLAQVASILGRGFTLDALDAR